MKKKKTKLGDFQCTIYADSILRIKLWIIEKTDVYIIAKEGWGILDVYI